MMKQHARWLIFSIIVSVFIIFSTSAAATEKKMILFHESVTAEQVNDYAANWEPGGAVLVDRLPFINGIILRVPDAITSENLGNDPRLLSVEDDQPMELQAAPPEEGSEAAAAVTPLDGNPLRGNQIPWGIVHLYDMPHDPFSLTTQLKSSNTPDLVDEARSWGKITNLRVAIFDTGVDINHPKLGNLIKEGVDFVNMIEGTPMDDNGHGTHVAATLVGYKLGLARGCELYSAKVLDHLAMGEVSTLVSALQWAIENQIHVINMSIAFRDDHPAVRMAIKEAHEAGIIMIAAVGNHSNWEEDDAASSDGGASDGGASDGGASDGGASDGGASDGGASDGGASGDDSFLNPFPVMYPAAYPEVIAVGAHDSLGEFTSFSNVGPEMDLTAPGKEILSANRTDISQYGVCSGTSMATPLVSGTVALMLALDSDHSMSTEEVRDILTATAIDGRLNLTGALEEVAYRNMNPPEAAPTNTDQHRPAAGRQWRHNR